MSKIALCVGHSRRIGSRRDGGAVAADGQTNEWSYNSRLGRELARRLSPAHEVLVVMDYEGAGYTTAMRWLAGRLREEQVDLAVELHFNAANGAARGHEWLHWHTSRAGKQVAVELHVAVARAFPTMPQRGLKPRGPGDRGAEFLKLTHCPAVIAEPFFGDNPVDWRGLGDEEGMVSLAAAMAAGLDSALKRF